LISSPAFKGLNTIKQHKLVNECLKEDIKSIHGLQVRIQSQGMQGQDADGDLYS